MFIKGLGMQKQLKDCQQDLLCTRKKMTDKQSLTKKEIAALMVLLHETADIIGMITQGPMV